MILSQLFSQVFLAYSDLGLFLAVIGVYVFFAALWLIYGNRTPEPL